MNLASLIPSKATVGVAGAMLAVILSLYVYNSFLSSRLDTAKVNIELLTERLDRSDEDNRRIAGLLERQSVAVDSLVARSERLNIRREILNADAAYWYAQARKLELERRDEIVSDTCAIVPLDWGAIIGSVRVHDDEDGN